MWHLATGDDTAEHAHESTGPGASDEDVLAYAAEHGAVIVTADTDFGALLAHAKSSRPSVVLVRELLSLGVTEQGQLLAANLEQVRQALTRGAVVAVSPTELRVRRLPIG